MIFVVRDYESQDLDALKRTESDPMLAFFDNVPQGLLPFPSYSKAYTMLSEYGNIAAIGGILPMWHGVGEAWFYKTPVLLEAPIQAAKAWRRIMSDAEKDFHRIQTAVRLGEKTAKRFIEFLGFEPEGIMTKFGPEGADYVRYAKCPLQ